MANKHQNKNKQTAGLSDPRLAYLHSIGLTDKTAADLAPPSIDKFATTASDDFELIGKDVHKDFEYYRAVDDQSVRKAEQRGYFKLPSGADVRYRGCHTPNEIMMARTIEQGNAYRAQEHAQRQALRSGNRNASQPMGGGAVYNEQTVHSHVQVNTQER